MTKINFRTFITESFERILEGETGTGANQDPGTGTGTGNDPGTGTGNNDPPVDDSDKKYTKAELDRVVEQERKRAKDATQKTIQDLENLKRSNQLSETNRTALETKIQELNDSLLSKEELARKEKERLTTEHQTKLQQVQDQSTRWETLYKESTVRREILDAAVELSAFDPEQIEFMVRPNARVVEETDQDNNPTGKFVTKVRLPSTDKDGKPVTLDVSVKEAVKAMKDTPEKYGNLFKDLGTGGIGGGQSNAPRGTLDVTKMSHAQYMQHRKSLVGVQSGN